MTVRSVIATVLLAASTSLAIAQPAPDQKPAAPTRPMMQQPGGMGVRGDGLPAGHPMMGAGRMAMHPGMMAGCEALGAGQGDHIEGRLAFLKTEIGITGAQSAQWDAFANTLRTEVKNMRAAMGNCAAAAQTQSAPDRTEMMIAHMTVRLDSLKSILAAEKPLYAALSDEQKKKADDLLVHPGMGAGMGWGMGSGMGQGMGQGMMYGRP